MERFLSQCAKYIFEKHNHELYRICLVFPNRRAGVLFNAYLQDELKRPVMGTEITTIAELISGLSKTYKAEKLELIAILYDVFKKHTNTTETFDEFYFWGEILLSDFAEIDRYMVNAKDLFTNLSDLKKLETVFDYLTRDQKEALKQFWGTFPAFDKKEFQKKYAKTWEKLYPVYRDYKAELKKKELTYSGMAEREVVERLETENFSLTHSNYYFIGLNVLSSCEKRFFRFLKKQQKATFLWDYDDFYLNDIKNEAGKFIRKNKQEFPPPKDFILDTGNFIQNKRINLVAVSSVYGQAQQIPVFIEEVKKDFNTRFDNTAIVLADEALLFSTLSALPAEVEKANITMGYEVKNSVVYGFLTLMINLLKNARKKENQGFVCYHRFVTDLLSHQLLRTIESEKTAAFLNDVKIKNRIVIQLNELQFSALQKRLFTLPEEVENFSDYFLEVLGLIYRELNIVDSKNKILLELIFTVYRSVEKLKAVVAKVTADKGTLSPVVYFRLFSQYLSQVSVAFEGEPLNGMQVMGILETRCLDFENLLILGLNENKWPRSFTAPSFIPYNVRKGFGLPGIDEQDAMYSYYFYRLIQRAKNVTATYSVVKEGISTGELSRYGYQLQFDSPHKPALSNFEYSFGNNPVLPISIKSSEETVSLLLEKNTAEHALSPSAINTFLDCSLRFYFRYAAGLPEPEDVKEEIDPQVFGTVFHEVMEQLYKPFIGKSITKSDLSAIQKKSARIENEILRQISIHYFKEKEPFKTTLEGKHLLVFENLKTYVNRVIEIDKENAPFVLINLEQKYFQKISFELDEKQVLLHIGGTIDRIDRVGDTVRVIDYKTGQVKKISFSAIDELFLRDEKTPKKEILQALIYTWVFSVHNRNLKVQPAIYALRNLFGKDFNPEINWDKHEFDWQELEPEFLTNLKKLIGEIYSTETVFKQTEHVEKCGFCAFHTICQRY